MNRTVRGALIGGVVGALVATAQAVRAENDPPEVVTVQAVKGLAQGVLVGAAVGWLLDRSDDVRATVTRAYEAARPRVDDAVDRVRSLAA